MLIARLSIIIFCISSLQVRAQVYNPVPRSADAFSTALVKTLNCAANYFKDCKGDSLQYTVLQELEHRLNIDFPGSAAAIIRERNYDRNAYIEFRGYPDTQSLKKGVKELIDKIKKALGDQLYEDESVKRVQTLYYTSASLSVKDANGFFSPNMELMVSSSSSVYLLPGKQGDGPKQHFILLKIYGRVPNYNYFIPAGIESPDPQMSDAIRRLTEHSLTDFVSLVPPGSVLKKRKRTDTITINGVPAVISRRGANRSAYINIPGNGSVPDSGWTNALRVVQAALGPSYVYSFSSLFAQDSYHFYVPNSNGSKAFIYLEKGGPGKDNKIWVRVLSPISHPVKRSRSKSDWEDTDW